MIIVYALAASIMVACAIYMILSRNLVRLLLGISLLATATNLIIFQAGRTRSPSPALIREGATRLQESADPLPQALVLTAIVIGFALTLVLTALALRAWRSEGTLDSGSIRSAERLGDPDEPVAREE